MVSNLYEVLGLDRSASPQDIRKAYKKRALQTHPDRLSPSTTAEDKAKAAEQFRLVNNAYEVLNDYTNRKLYDQHGVWPPPSVNLDPPRHQTDEQWRGDAFSSSSFGGFGPQSSPFGFPSMGAHPRFAFTDPFELFHSLFGDLEAHFANDPFIPSSSSTRSMFDPPFGQPFGPSFGSSFGGSPFESYFGGPLFSEPMNSSGGSGVRSYSSTSQSVSSGGRWVSESRMTRMIDGRTEVIHQRRDAEGNEHITYSLPEGERYTINGIEQSNHAFRSSTTPAAIQDSRGSHAIPQSFSQSSYHKSSEPEKNPVNRTTSDYAPPLGPPSVIQASHNYPQNDNAWPPRQNGYFAAPPSHNSYGPPPPQPTNTAYYNQPSPVNTSTYPSCQVSSQMSAAPGPVPVPRSPQDSYHPHARSGSQHSTSSRNHRGDHRPHDHHSESLNRRSHHSRREDERRTSYPYREEDRERRSRGPATPAYEDQQDKKRWWRGGW